MERVEAEFCWQVGGRGRMAGMRKGGREGGNGNAKKKKKGGKKKKKSTFFFKTFAWEVLGVMQNADPDARTDLNGACGCDPTN